MKIRIRAFANVKDILGFDEKIISMPERSRVSDVVKNLSAEHPGLKSVSGIFLFARNEKYCSRDTMLSENDVLAIFPPVSGG